MESAVRKSQWEPYHAFSLRLLSWGSRPDELRLVERYLHNFGEVFDTVMRIFRVYGQSENVTETAIETAIQNVIETANQNVIETANQIASENGRQVLHVHWTVKHGCLSDLKI